MASASAFFVWRIHETVWAAAWNRYRLTIRHYRRRLTAARMARLLNTCRRRPRGTLSLIARGASQSVRSPHASLLAWQTASCFKKESKASSGKFERGFRFPSCSQNGACLPRLAGVGKALPSPKLISHHFPSCAFHFFKNNVAKRLKLF